MTSTSDRRYRNDPRLHDRKRWIDILEQILPIPLKGGTDDDVRMTWRRKHVTASMDRDVAVLLRRRHDVVTRMLSNVIWFNLGTKKAHIALVSRLQSKKNNRSDQIRSNPRMVQKTIRLIPRRWRISFMCAVYTDVFYLIWMWSRSDLIWSDLIFLLCLLAAPEADTYWGRGRPEGSKSNIPCCARQVHEHLHDYVGLYMTHIVREFCA
jgi:hypothetical protein